jgi:hypothetical protein
MLTGELVVFSVVLGKLKLVGEIVRVGATALPLRVTIWVAGLALSVTVTLAAGAPVDLGVNVTVIVQIPPGSTIVPQVLVSK